MFLLSIKLLVLKLSLLILTTSSQLQYNIQQPCACLNGGQCLYNLYRQSRCNCLQGYIQDRCIQVATPMTNMLNQTITQQYRYFYYTIRKRSAYLININFSSNTKDLFQIEMMIKINSNQHIKDQDNRIDRYFSISPYQNYAFFLQANINQYQGMSQENIQIIIRIRRYNGFSNASKQQRNQTSNIGISFQIVNLNMINNQQEIYYFLVFTTSLLIIFFICSYTICKMIIRMRPRRFARPVLAQPYNNIAHFDKQFPGILYQSVSCQHKNEYNDCAICLLSLQQTTVRILPCKHIFHKECIDKWGVASLTCPICRMNIKTQSNQIIIQQIQIDNQFQ